MTPPPTTAPPTPQTTTAAISPGPSTSAWGERIRALKNVPPVLHIVWESGPSVVTWGIVLRVVIAFLPVTLGKVSAWILNGVDEVLRHQPLRPHFWWVVALEVSLAVIAGMVNRLMDYFDNLLADRYTHHVSIEVMRHAAALDVTAYEDPVFYDRLERARAQATDRLAMIQSMGRLLQQAVTALVFTGALLYYSPWLALLLAVGVLPSFLGETHFAFLGYAKNFRQTPAKRQMDYLRQLGGSKEAAKELKLFGLSEHLTSRFAGLAGQIYDENLVLSKKKLYLGGLLGIAGTLGYYGAYAFVIWRGVHGAYDIGTLAFLISVIAQASSTL
ncbi:MAG TPA: ABC transporter ATP-binding protein, partial [Acidisarcina sp.]